MQLVHEQETTTFPIVHWDGRKLIVYLDETWHDIFGTHDSNWQTTDGQLLGDWLHYVNANNVQWRARTDCEYHDDTKNTRVRATIAQGKDGNDQDDRLGLLIIDWEGKRWAIEFMGVHNSGNKQKPTFKAHDLAFGTPSGY